MTKTLLTYSSLMLACFVVIVAFITTTTYIQLAISILLYPILAFFAYKVLPIKQRYTEPTAQVATISLERPKQEARDTKINNNTKNVGIADIDKRVFLKLIGGAGITLFLFSIFNKKTEGLFPGTTSGPGLTSLKDTAGNKIDPAQKKPLDGYSVSDIENGIIIFHGFISEDGSWYIMRVDTDTGTFRYAKNNSNYLANWTKRENLKYDYFDNVFRP